MGKLRTSGAVLAAMMACLPAGAYAQSLGPDYSQRSLSGGNDSSLGGGDIATRDTGPVACIYQFSHRLPLADRIDLVRSGYVTKTRKQQMTFHLIGETIAACRGGQGWGPARQNAALQYFSGRVYVDDALHEGHDLGLDAVMLRGLADHLDPSTKAAFDAGRVDGTQMAAALGGLAAVGLDPAGLTEDQRARLGRLVAQGLWGMHLQEAAKSSFKKG